MVPSCFPGEPFELVTAISVDGITRLRLSGELDVAATSTLERRLADVVASGGEVVLDCSGLTFIDAGGIATLLVAYRAAIRAGGSLRIESATPTVTRTFHLTKLGFLLAAPDCARN
jgi:anti-anti-sigma factor